MYASTNYVTRNILSILFVAFILAGPSAGPAFAQDVYVGGSVLGNIVRWSGADDDQNGESFGGGLRVGTSLGDRWGVDLEFVYPGAIETEYPANILASRAQFEFLSRVTVPGPGGLTIFPPISATMSSRQSTLTSMLWARQRMGDRVELMYLGGIAFIRSEVETELRVDALPLGSFLRPGDSTTLLYDNDYVNYDVGPAVGMDARVRMTEHLRLVPGIRLLTASDSGRTGWLIRPSIGLHWDF